MEDTGKTQSLSELASQNLPGENTPVKVDPEQAGKDAAMIAALRSRGRDEAVVLDPSERGEAFRQLESWVDGSLDIYRVCFAFILLTSFTEPGDSMNLDHCFSPYIAIFIWT